MGGVFGLGSHLELMEKLECEFQQLIANPSNAYHAYNFFVTAWHLVEWKYPDVRDTPKRNALRDQIPLLQICEHLAVGAKHFEPRSTHLNAVSSSQRSGAWAVGVWARNAWGKDVWSNWLSVSLSGEAQKSYGDQVRVDDLARKVMDYWRAHI